MAGFPKLIPAFEVQIHITAPFGIGSINAGPNLNQVAFLPSTGYVRSVASYSAVLDAEFVHGSDYLKVDPDGRHVRLDVTSLVKDRATGALVRYVYTGVIGMGGAAGKVLRGEADAATTDFGEAYTRVYFESGSKEFKDLENKVFVAAGRFILEEGKPVIVEYKVSEVSS